MFFILRRQREYLVVLPAGGLPPRHLAFNGLKPREHVTLQFLKGSVEHWSTYFIKTTRYLKSETNGLVMNEKKINIWPSMANLIASMASLTRNAPSSFRLFLVASKFYKFMTLMNFYEALHSSQKQCNFSTKCHYGTFIND